ncbi:hypothetical protein [Cohnella terricola]|uniref:LysM domain-containing protein n=1 Tax=Cohnella terricola TaxID=1289167 RepID=A0A559JMT6_9BACL|nr:hypothetical protein [Cohnella terricola]TVY01189.1 hypothetical protein FPZ45_08545 [Cohnella terricola]
MKNTVRTLGITAALAVMIPLSAYAAATSGISSGNADAKTEAVDRVFKGGDRMHRGGFEFRGGAIVGDDVLKLLKLDKETYKEKLDAGLTLAQIAEEQGVSRESLKSAMTESYNKKLEEQKQKFADNLDSLIDSKPQADKRGGFMAGGKGLTAVADTLGLTEEELMKQLKAGKTLADLAADKGVDVQKLIDAQKAAIESDLNVAVQAGTLTQEQADKRLGDVEKMAQDFVNGKGFGFGGERHHGGFKAPRIDGAKPSATPETSGSAAK